MPILIPTDILDFDTIQLTDDGSVSNCTHPAGHCFGSDGGSGIPTNLKVAKDRGGEFEVWKLSTNKNKVETKYRTERCQYCLKYHVVEEIAL